MDTEPKRRGRPPLAPADRKDRNLTFRTRGDLRARLDQAARENGRTVSQEVEFRLNQSFAAGDLRQIVREEIAAAQAPKLPFHDALSLINQMPRDQYDNSASVHVLGRDHLPS